MKKGISLCGGGSRGSYELGVWQALRELNMKFNIVTGSSIGALNGLMLIQDDFENCEKLWDAVNIEKVMGNGINIEELNVIGLLKNEYFPTFLKQALINKGTDISPFKSMVKEYLKEDVVKSSKMKLGVVVANFPKMIKEEILINEQSNENMYNYLIATASCFPAFPICKFDSKQYVDGGYVDNLPIDYAFKLGATEVVAVDLNYRITHKRYLNNPLVDYIYPKWDLGSMLYFEQSTIQRNKKLGYFDAMKFYCKFFGVRYTFNKFNKKNIAKKVTASIITDSMLAKKKNDDSIFTYLNEHINNPTYYDYYIKCVEEVLYILEFSSIKLYDLEDVIKSIKYCLSDIDEDFKTVFELFTTDTKKANFLLKANKKLALNYFYNNQVSNNIKILLLENSKELYLSLLFIETIKNKEAVKK